MPYWQVKGRLDLAVTDLGKTPLKNIAEPVPRAALSPGTKKGQSPMVVGEAIASGQTAPS
jgi:hypothetical protein